MDRLADCITDGKEILTRLNIICIVGYCGSMLPQYPTGTTMLFMTGFNVAFNVTLARQRNTAP